MKHEIRDQGKNMAFFLEKQTINHKLKSSKTPGQLYIQKTNKLLEACPFKNNSIQVSNLTQLFLLYLNFYSTLSVIHT